MMDANRAAEIAEWVMNNTPTPLDDDSAFDVCKAYLDLLATNKDLERRLEVYRCSIERIRHFAETVRFDPLALCQPELSIKSALNNASYILEEIDALASLEVTDAKSV